MAFAKTPAALSLQLDRMAPRGSELPQPQGALSARMRVPDVEREQANPGSQTARAAPTGEPPKSPSLGGLPESTELLALRKLNRQLRDEVAKHRNSIPEPVLAANQVEALAQVMMNEKHQLGEMHAAVQQRERQLLALISEVECLGGVVPVTAKLCLDERTMDLTREHAVRIFGEDAPVILPEDLSGLFQDHEAMRALLQRMEQDLAFALIEGQTMQQIERRLKQETASMDAKYADKVAVMQDLEKWRQAQRLMLKESKHLAEQGQTDVLRLHLRNERQQEAHAEQLEEGAWKLETVDHMIDYMDKRDAGRSDTLRLMHEELTAPARDREAQLEEDGMQVGVVGKFVDALEVKLTEHVRAAFLRIAERHRDNTGYMDQDLNTLFRRIVSVLLANRSVHDVKTDAEAHRERAARELQQKKRELKDIKLHGMDMAVRRAMMDQIEDRNEIAAKVSNIQRERYEALQRLHPQLGLCLSGLLHQMRPVARDQGEDDPEPSPRLRKLPASTSGHLTDPASLDAPSPTQDHAAAEAEQSAQDPDASEGDKWTALEDQLKQIETLLAQAQHGIDNPPPPKLSTLTPSRSLRTLGGMTSLARKLGALRTPRGEAGGAGGGDPAGDPAEPRHERSSAGPRFGIRS